VEDRGLEIDADSSEYLHGPVQRGAFSGAFSARTEPDEGDLAMIRDRWENLPEDVRDAVLVLVGGTVRADVLGLVLSILGNTP